MKNKKGFISTSIVYAFFLVFILIMIATIMSFANKRFLIKKIESDCEYPGEDIVISCQEGDKLSDCLFIAEHKEAEKLYEKVQQGEDLTEAESEKWRSIRRVSTATGKIDLSLSKERIINSIKNEIDIRIELNFDPKYELGLYKYSDDLGNTYYYRGAEDDNFVLFANKLWSIVRINGDGSIRLVYQGQWDKINSLMDINAKKDYIKNYSYIDMDSNGEKNSNDARHYNVNNPGELMFTWDDFMYALNQDLIMEYCDNKTTQISNSLEEFIKEKNCSLLKGYGEAKLQKILNYGNEENNGSYYLTNAGFMSNGAEDVDTKTKLLNKNPSTIMNMINAWYDSNIKDYEKDIYKDALFCANKDVVLQENGALVEDKYCYCYGSHPVIGAWNSNIEMLNSGICSNKFSGGLINTQGQCYKEGFIDGLQINYHLQSSFTNVRGGASLKCLDLDNSSFSVNKERATKIERPVGLLTASEIKLAGGAYREKNSNFYLSTDYNYWTGDLAFGNNNAGYDLNTYYFAYIGNKDNTKPTPESNITLNTEDHVLDILGDYNNVAHIKPVINLKANVKYKNGNGSIEAPYEIGE